MDHRNAGIPGRRHAAGTVLVGHAGLGIDSEIRYRLQVGIRGGLARRYIISSHDELEEVLDSDGTQGGEDGNSGATRDDSHRDAPMVRAGDLDHVLEGLQQVHEAQEVLVPLTGDLLDEVGVSLRQCRLDEGLRAVAAPRLKPLLRHLEPVATEHLVPADSIEPHRVNEGAIAVEEQGLCLRRDFGREHRRMMSHHGLRSSSLDAMRFLTFNLRTLAALPIAAVLALGIGAPAAHADDYSRMNATELEQAVLRAQMPKTLGSWSQNYYFSENDARFTRPTLCWDRSGDVNLPNSKNMGSVGYAVGSNGSSSVTIYQYADQAKAQAALTAMKNNRCADNPIVMTDGGDKVKAESGSDFTDDSLTGYVAGLTYKQDDKILFDNIYTTQRGLAIVQTRVTRWVDTPMAMEQQQDTVSKLSAVNKSWHANAVKAYENFGQGNSR